MRVSIIPEDKRIIVDGKTVDLDDNDIRWEFDDEHIHAIQWKNNKGEIEYEDVDGEDPLPNKPLGEEDFDTIIKPYIDFFNEFLTIAEKRELQFSLENEERIANELNELNLSKLQEEENIVIINDLQDQNRKVREDYEKIADELEQVLEERSISERELRLQHEREIYEKNLELQSEETAKIDEYFRKKSSDFTNHIESLIEELENQKEEFLEEKKQFAVYIQKYKSSIEQEVDEIQKTIASDMIQREIADQITEKQRLADEEQIILMRQTSELEQQSLELAFEELKQEKTRIMRERRLELQRNELDQKQLDAEREELLLDVALRREKDLEDKIDKDEQNALQDWQSNESLRIEQDYIKKQKEKFEDYINERQGTYRDIEERIKLMNLENDSNGPNDISSILDEMDPEDFYASLTDEQKETNSFPVQKATAWFNKLKEVMEKNEQ